MNLFKPIHRKIKDEHEFAAIAEAAANKRLAAISGSHPRVYGKVAMGGLLYQTYPLAPSHFTYEEEGRGRLTLCINISPTPEVACLTVGGAYFFPREHLGKTAEEISVAAQEWTEQIVRESERWLAP